MKIKIFVARKIPYFELGIFSFKLYIYYLIRVFIASIRAFNLITRAFNLPTRAFNLTTRAFSLQSRGFELLARALLFRTLIVFDLRYKINFRNKQDKNIFYWKFKLNPVSVAALQDWPLLHRVLQNVILHPIIPNLQTNPYWLNIKIIISLHFISTIIK